METRSRPFVPPHCPRSDCRFHRCAAGWHWVHFGCYHRQAAPQRIQRFLCVACGHTFSTQTFSTTYWLSRPTLLAQVFYRVLACSAFRQIAREARCHANTVMRLVARLGRHCLLFLTLHRPRGPLEEPLVIDGFESFEFSQYTPIHLHLAVGARSHFAYAFTDSELRRKGRMTEPQRRRRAALEHAFGRPAPRAIENDVATLMRIAVLRPQALTVRSDEHPAYPRAFRHLSGYAISHERTSSRARRTPRNPLFPVNLLDLLLRHGSANHKRETIAFSKRRQGAIERAAMLLVWRNYAKRFSERRGGPTPAMRLGHMERPISIEEVLAERLFPGRIELPDLWKRYYRREVPTRRIPHPATHRLKLAF
jgi:transposase-like protein